MRISIAAVLVAIATSGCATSFEDLKKDPAGDERFEVSLPLEETYRVLVTEARRCFEDGPMRITGDLFPDAKTATVTFGAYMSTGTIAFIAADLRPVPGGSTEVHALYRRGGAGYLKTMRSWFAGGPRSCKLP